MIKDNRYDDMSGVIVLSFSFARWPDVTRLFVGTWKCHVDSVYCVTYKFCKLLIYDKA